MYRAVDLLGTVLYWSLFWPMIALDRRLSSPVLKPVHDDALLAVGIAYGFINLGWVMLLAWLIFDVLLGVK